jgi:hypothetical protein
MRVLQAFYQPTLNGSQERPTGKDNNMKIFKRYRLVASALTMLAIAIPAMAHHALTAEFDPTRNFTVTGTLSRVEWANPHIYIYVDVKKGDQVDTYGFEAGPPVSLNRAGVKKADFKVGETVTITALAAKDGTKLLGHLSMIKYADGHVFVYRDGSE